MNLFYFKECTSKTVADIKTTKKRQSNNKNAIDNFSLLLNDTKIAIGNIESCLEAEEESRRIYVKMINGDMTFADDMLGLSQKGGNDSHYRSYLALDKTSIIEVRIGNHYETKKAAKQKSNNKSQYLFQVVVSENEQSVPNGSESIKNVCRVGNLRVLTKKFLSSESPMEDFIEILQSIHDYLISPSESYDAALSAQTNDAQSTQVANKQNTTNNKNVVRLTESELKRIIAESVRRVLKEGANNALTPMMKPKLIKKYDNDSDWYVCVYKMPNGSYAVTDYDIVSRKHEKVGSFDTYEQANAFAKKRSKEFNFG